MKSLSLRILLALLCAVLGALAAALAGAVLYLDSQPDLQVWHTANLDEEFRRDHGVETFEDYLALEDRLFRQLDTLVYGKVRGAEKNSVNRYTHGSLSDPGRWERNWNRTFEMTTPSPEAGVLLIHGLTDSPYSLRALAERLHACNAYVVGLRVPGHGTAPSALADIAWQDMAAAVRIGAKRVRDRIGDKPLYIVGYSNGGALAVDYTLDSIRDETLPRPERLVLMSPEIGVTPAAAFAAWQERLGHLLGLGKLQWTSILPEYDPFKCNSFPVNAGNQVYRLTKSLRTRLDALHASADRDKFPPVLAFQSAVDATVSAPALVEVLFDNLPPDHGNELVLYDLNRRAVVEALLAHDPKAEMRRLLDVPGRTFDVTVVTNRDAETGNLVAKLWKPEAREADIRDIDATWPEDVYSLAHIALPFRKDDPLYGDNAPPTSPGVALGDLALRGERGVLAVSPADQLRMHWNPFYSYQEKRTLDFLGLKPKPPRTQHEPRLF